MKHTRTACLHDRNCQLRRQCMCVLLGDLSTPIITPIKMAQFDAQNSRMDFIESTVQARNFANEALSPTVLTELPHFASQILVVRDDHAAIPDGTKVLRRIEAETARDAPVPNSLVAVQRSMRLSAVFDNVNSVRLGNR